jgi:hypothetical protein
MTPREIASLTDAQIDRAIADLAELSLDNPLAERFVRELATRRAATPTNMPWAVYRCHLIKRGEVPTGEEFVSGHMSPSEAMGEANRLKRTDRANSYTVGGA